MVPPGLKGVPAVSFRTSSFLTSFTSSRLASSLGLFSSEVDCAAAGRAACNTDRQTISRTWSEKDRTRKPGKSRFTAPPSSRPTGMAARLRLPEILSLGFPKTRAIARCSLLNNLMGRTEQLACGSIAEREISVEIVDCAQRAFIPREWRMRGAQLG